MKHFTQSSVVLLLILVPTLYKLFFLNFTGTYWGEYGFFRIGMYGDNLGIEESCVWAVPKLL